MAPVGAKMLQCNRTALPNKRMGTARATVPTIPDCVPTVLPGSEKFYGFYYHDESQLHCQDGVIDVPKNGPTLIRFLHYEPDYSTTDGSSQPEYCGQSGHTAGKVWFGRDQMVW